VQLEALPAAVDNESLLIYLPPVAGSGRPATANCRIRSRGSPTWRAIPTHEVARYFLGGPNPVTNGTSFPPFSPARYSRYKYGSGAAAQAFAQALGTAFGERHPDLILAPRLLMASSPYVHYAHVPAAATSLARDQPGQPRRTAGFLRRMPAWFIRDLHRNSRMDGYARMRAYAPSHAVVRAELARRTGGRAEVACGTARRPA
jgi:hypothetical protein